MALFCISNIIVLLKKILLGGPLHLGDIEDMCSGSNYPCIICPWHKWTFDLRTGKQLLPKDKNKKLQVYPVKISSTGQISIGFKCIDPSFFSQQCMDF